MVEKEDMLLDKYIQKHGETLYISVGGKGGDCKYNGNTSDIPNGNGGWNGGGTSAIDGDKFEGGGGGGATSIQTTLIDDGQLKNYENNKDDVLVVAGGGGGAFTLGGWSGGEYQNANNSGASGGGLYGGANSYNLVIDNEGTKHETGTRASQTEGYKFGMGDSCAGGGWYGGYKTYWSPGGGGSGHINENKVSNGSMQNGYTKEESKNGNGYAQITLVSIDDTTPPTCTITPQVGNPTNASTIQYNINFSEEVYNFERTDISVQNGTITNFWGSGANYAITVTNGGSCTQTITVGANVCNDFAGNGNIGASASRLIDRTLPTIAVNPASGGYAKSRNVTITVGDAGGAGLSLSLIHI